MTEDKDSESKAVTIVIVITVFAVASYIAAAFYFNWGISGKPSSWGPFGDYVGGIINPAIAMAALYVLVKVSKHQKAEFYATRTHLETEAKKNEIYRVISHIDRKLELMLSINVQQKNNVGMVMGTRFSVPIGRNENEILGPLSNYLMRDSWGKHKGEVYVLLGDSGIETPLTDYLPQIRDNCLASINLAGFATTMMAG